MATLHPAGDMLFMSIDKRGNVAIPFHYSRAYPFSNSHAVVQDGETWVLIDKFGQKVKVLKFDSVGPPVAGLSTVSQNKKWGLIDTSGAIIVPLKYDYIEPNYGLPYAELNGNSFIFGRDGTDYYIP